MEFTRITVDPHQMGGLPYIRHLRIPVTTIVDMVAEGIGIEEILRYYPDLELEDVSEALRYATTYTAEEARQVAQEFRKRFAGRATSDSGELIREDRDR